MQTTHSEIESRLRELLVTSMPAMWPTWPYLCLVRRWPGGQEECGLLCDLLGLAGTPGYRATVFLSNLFTLPPTLEGFLALPREVYDTPEEVYAAGWRVD